MAKRNVKEKKKSPSSKKWEKYDTSGEKVDRKNKNCPKCGDGVFMARHHDRDTCGKCSYTEFRKK